jgi:hypothetical protein
VTVLLGNGDGTFLAKTVGSLNAGYLPAAITVGDFNRDGIPDLAVLSAGPQGGDNGALTILIGNGDGTFTAAAANPAVENEADDIAAADFNGNGVLDLVLVSTTGCPLGGCANSPGGRSAAVGKSDRGRDRDRIGCAERA